MQKRQDKCIVSYLEMPKIKDSHVLFLFTVVKSPQCMKGKCCTFLVKMVDYVEKLSPFSLFSLYASNNLVHILLQLGTFYAHYTNHKN